MSNKRIALILTLLFLLLLTPIASAKEETPAHIKAVFLIEEKTHLEVQAAIPSSTVDAHAGSLVYLFALEPGQIGTPLSSLTPIASKRIESSLFFRLQIEGRHADRIFAKYVIALSSEDGYTPLCEGRYLQSPNLLAIVKDPYPTAPSKKGLDSRIYTDAEVLGVCHAVLPVAINELLSAKETSASFRYLDKVYYLDPTRLDMLDYQVRRLSQAGVQVYLNLVLTAPDKETPTFLYYSSSSATAKFFAYQIENSEAAHLLEGLLIHLTTRYTRPDRAYGFAAAFIVGYEVNSNRFRNFRGETTMGEAVSSYAKLVRHVATATRSVYQNAKVYISLANNWNIPCIDPTVTPSPTLDYASYDFLMAFGKEMAAQGEPIPWSVAINPYPSDLHKTDFWNDEKATDQINSPYLTMKNIDLLTELLSHAPFAQEAFERTVLISEFGVSGKIGTPSEQTQAAAFVYAYCKAAANPCIDAMIWHRQVDHLGEDDLYFGLWSSRNSALLSPAEKKQIYEVFRFIDTLPVRQDAGEDVTRFAKELIDDPAYAALRDALPTQSLITRRFFEAVATPPSNLREKETTLFDFSRNNLYGFYPSDAARFIELREHQTYGAVLHASLFSTESADHAGIAYYGQSPIKIGGQSHIKLLLNAAHGKESEQVTLMLRMSGKDASGNPVIYEGVTAVTPGAFCTVLFPIADFSESVQTVDSFKIWISGHKDESALNQSDECVLQIASISLLSPTAFSFFGILIQITVIGAITVTLLFIGYLVSMKLRTSRLKAERRTHRLLGAHHRYHFKRQDPQKDTDDHHEA